MTFYDTFNNKKHRKNQISVNLYDHQIENINKMVEKNIYHSRSECVRIGLEFFLSNEYIKNLNKKREKILSKIKKNNRKEAKSK